MKHISKMKKTLLILALALALIYPKNASASCAEPLTIAEYKAQADVVLVGVATSGGLFSEISVEDVYKGNVSLKISVSGAEGPEGAVTSVDFSFVEGSRYLLFLNESEDGIYRTNICNGNKAIGDEGLLDEDLVALQAGSSVPSLDNEQKDIVADEVVDTQTLQSTDSGSSLFIIVGLLLMGLLVYWVFSRKNK